MPQSGEPAQGLLARRAPEDVAAVDDLGSEHGEVTRLLRSAAAGDRSAPDRVLPLLYDDLRRLARRQLARESGAPAVQPTTLVHEAYLKLAGSTPRAADRAHLLAIAAHAMRQVLVDHARERRAEKRGPAWVRTTLTSGAWTTELDPDTLLALDEALERLESLLGVTLDWTDLSRFLPDSEDPAYRRSALASTFVAALELVRQGRAELSQAEALGPLHLRARR